jgi:GTPase SAR1 family protein
MGKGLKTLLGKFKKQKIRILLLGLDAAGKTSKLLSLLD